jgi:hypothetical protein
MKSRHVVVRRIIFTGAFIFVAAYAFIFSVEWRRRELAQELCADVQRLHVGATTDAEVQSLSRKYKGTYTNSGSDQPAYYLLSIWSPLFIVGQQHYALPGRRTWGAQAYLPVKDRHLSMAYFWLSSSRSNGLELSGSARLTGSQPFGAPEGVTYHVRQAHLTGPPTESLIVELSPAATPQERRKGFDFNFSCLTGFRECRHVCELMPTAWKDLPKDSRIQHNDGQDKVMDSECRERVQ